MNKQKWELAQEQEFNFLKTLKLPASYFKGYVHEIMDKIEDEFITQYRENQEIDDPYIFNAIDEWEFMDWVKDNYNIKWDEEIRHYFVQ